MDKNTEGLPSVHASRKHQWLAVLIVIFAAVAVGALVLLAAQRTLQTYLAIEGDLEQTVPPPTKSTEIPQVQTETVLSGLNFPWDLAFLPDQQTIFTERSGTVSVIKDGNRVQIADIENVYANGEGGLMGLAVDPQFAENRYIYTCYNSAPNPDNPGNGPFDIRVVRWKVNSGTTALEDRTDLITGIPATGTGRHSGCRIAFGPDGYLWVGTGDSAQASHPQDPKSLGGKIIRVDRDGKAASGNLGGDFDTRIYSYGHRNTQGLAFAPQPINSVIGYSVEHGTIVDDELNALVKGNFGWGPAAYDAITENATPMTDKSKFPDAIDPVWASGDPTQAPSGANFIDGRKWKAWDGALAIAMLKTSHLKILTFDENGKVAKEDKILTDQSRLRAVRQGPDGNLYVLTSNGQNDQIIRIMVKE